MICPGAQGGKNWPAGAYNPKTNRWNARAAPGIFGSATRVTVDASARVFMATGGRSAVYTP